MLRTSASCSRAAAANAALAAAASAAAFPSPSKFMEEQLLRARPKILKFLRESANNFSLDLHIQVLETEAKKFVYTPQEKFEKLKEINPNIELLRKRFKLDL